MTFNGFECRVEQNLHAEDRGKECREAWHAVDRSGAKECQRRKDGENDEPGNERQLEGMKICLVLGKAQEHGAQSARQSVPGQHRWDGHEGGNTKDATHQDVQRPVADVRC